jgi:glutathione S-transferase
VTVPLVSVDLGKGEQHSDAYRAINPRRVVPTLVLADGTAIGEVLAIWRYLEEAYPTPPLLGSTPKDKALVTMWERRADWLRCPSLPAIIFRRPTSRAW